MRCDAVPIVIGYVVPLQYKNNAFWIFKNAISRNCGKLMTTCGMSDELNIGTVMLTKIGQELAPICGSKPVDGFMDYVMENWKNHLPKDDTEQSSRT